MGVRRLEFSSSRIVSNPKLWIYFMYNSNALVMTILIPLDFIVLHDFKNSFIYIVLFEPYQKCVRCNIIGI